MPKSTGKYKNWESFSTEINGKKICFAQSTPTKRAPSSITRESSRLFVTFRPNEEIKDEQTTQNMKTQNTNIYTWNTNK